MNLYQVESHLGSRWVVAESFADAHSLWARALQSRYPNATLDPATITRICATSDLVLPDGVTEFIAQREAQP